MAYEVLEKQIELLPKEAVTEVEHYVGYLLSIYGKDENQPSKKEFFDNLYSKLAVAEKDLKAGRVSDADDAINEIREKYGL